MRTLLLCFALAAACKSGSSTGADKPGPTALAGADRCKQAIAHIESFTPTQPQRTADDPPPPPSGDEPPAGPPDPKQLDQARAAGILGDPAADCAKSWTNATVDCILAAPDRKAADSCILKPR